MSATADAASYDARSRPMPSLPGVTHRYVDLPGLRMHVAEARPQDPAQGDPLLLLHGFPQHWWEWREVIPGLAERHRVICPDLRGAGWTDAPRGGYRRTQLLADLVALLDELGLDRVRVMAHDWSAILGFQLCLAHPGRVSSYVSVATPHPCLRFDIRLLRLVPHLWFQRVIIAPFLGRWLLGRPGQRFTRYLMLHFSAEAWSEPDLEHFTAPFHEPARARAGVALYRGFIIREAMRMMLGRYRGQRLTLRPWCSTAWRTPPCPRGCSGATRSMPPTWSSSRSIGRATSSSTTGPTWWSIGRLPTSPRTDPDRSSGRRTRARRWDP